MVGEGGISPDYFFSKMSEDEAADFIEGFRKRQRDAWTIARIGWYMNCDHNKVQSPEELFPLPWDKKKPKVSEQMKRKELNALRERAMEMQKLMNDGK